MVKESAKQKKKIKRVMHEHKNGKLKSGKNGKGGKVKSRKQAIAIAMHEAGVPRKGAKKQRSASKSTKRTTAKRKTKKR
jgi:hypothetical protein